MTRVLLMRAAAAAATVAAAAGVIAPASLGSAPLSGSLVYATFQPDTYDLEIALYDLATGNSSSVLTYNVAEYEDGYVADSLYLPWSGEYIVSLQYDDDETQGFLLTVDVANGRVVAGVNTSFCYGIFLDPSDATNSTLTCLTLNAKCDGGTQCGELHSINRLTGADKQLSSFLPNYAPYTVDTYGTWPAPWAE
jgi:hypothetical protein